MELIDKKIIISEVPLFANLSAADRNFISERVRLVEYKKDQIIYEQGAPPDAFFCVILGRVIIYTKDPSGEKQILEYLHRGKYFGIISLLTGDPHSVTTQALNDSAVLVINKGDFDLILKRIPQLAIDLSRTLSRRLKRKDIHPKTIFESTIISVFSAYSRAGKSIYALNLALGLNKQTRKSVIIVDICPEDRKPSLPQRLDVKDSFNVFNLSVESEDSEVLLRNYVVKNAYGIDLLCFSYRQNDETVLKKLICVLTLLVNDYHYIILDLPVEMDACILSILNQSDSIHILSGAEQLELTRMANLIQRLKSEFNFQSDKIKVIVNNYELSNISYAQQMEIAKHSIFATLPRVSFQSSDRLVLDDPSCEYSLAIRRITREMGECFVGLVLGVGAGYGFCHIGVLKVIEEEKIPIDIIAGSSIGALIASLWAIGKSSQEILDITKEFKEPKHIWNLIDLTFPVAGFVKGNKLYKFLRRHLGYKTFYDAKMPLKIIASDVSRKEPRVLEKGSLVDAIMASCSMPGVFLPFKLKEETLFDGGVVSPLPTEPLFKMGVKKIIAVNVTPSKQDILRQYEKLKDATCDENINKHKWYNLKHHFQDMFKTNILNIVFSSVEMLQTEVAEQEAKLADIVIHPDCAGLYWLELHRAEEFARRGEFAARQNLDKILQIVNE